MRYVGGNRLTLLRNGEQYFPALLRALDAAEHEVFLETYIFADDYTGKSVAAALARAAGRGVAGHPPIGRLRARGFSPPPRRTPLRARRRPPAVPAPGRSRPPPRDPP